MIFPGQNIKKVIAGYEKLIKRKEKEIKEYREAILKLQNQSRLPR
jgi:hypothetical protein